MSNIQIELLESFGGSADEAILAIEILSERRECRIGFDIGKSEQLILE